MTQDCKLYGCNRDLEPDSTLVFTIDDVDLTVEVCAFHKEMFSDIGPENYNAGLSFNGQVEVRLVPAAVAIITEEG